MMVSGWRNASFVFLVLVFSLIHRVQARMIKDNLNYSPFNCVNQEWDIDMSDSAAAAKYLKEWLLQWQFNCDANRAIYPKCAYVGGIGSSFMFASKYFMESIELKDIFRPDHQDAPWLWADPNKDNCTLHLQSYDCFSWPISDCGYRPASEREPILVRELERIKKEMEHNPLRDIHQGDMDVCTFGRVLKKPVKFIHGVMMEYLTRPRPNILLEIRRRKRLIFENIPADRVTVAFEVRSGPGVVSEDRKPFTNLTEVLQILDKHVAEIEQVYGHTVGMVYLCSDVPELTYVSAEYMNKNYPRSYTFRTSHHVSLGNKGCVPPPRLHHADT